jgi:hypothetical protein
MNKFDFSIVLLFLLISFNIFAQSNSDSSQTISTFSGSVGITNNGFSIVPTFSLNAPATIINLAFRRKKFSFEPDIRLIFNASKGGMVYWVRYKAIEKENFNVRVGVHPAFSYIKRNVQENTTNNNIQITEMMRFGAFEVAPTYKVNSHFGVGLYFLKGHGFQKWGPQNTNVLFVNPAITNIKMGKKLRLNVFPTYYFLDIDKTQGNYITATAAVTRLKSPFRLSYSFNKTINSNIAGNRNFMWNVMLSYNFSQNFVKV